MLACRLKGFIIWLLVFCPARSEDSGQEMQSMVKLVLTPSLFLGYVMGPNKCLDTLGGNRNTCGKLMGRGAF